MDNSFEIKFLNPIFKNIDKIFFRENINIIYYEGSHMNYIYILNDDDIEYTFNGFYRDNYFVIIIDSYDKNLQVNIESKYVILLKLEWKKYIFKEKEMFMVDTSKLQNLKINSFILNIRKKLFDVINISLDDYLRIKNSSIIECYLNNYNNNIKNIKNISIFNKLLKYFK